MNPKIERRFVKGGQLRAKTGDKPGIEGYASVFDEPYDSGWFIETIKPGAFTRALKEKQDVRCLFNHNADNVLGRTKSGTLTLEEDKTGLHFACDTNPEIRIAADVQQMVDRGDVDGCSFGFMVNKVSWREEKNPEGNFVTYRDIEDVDLFDVGPVTYPAYEGTSVSARSLWPDGIPAEIRSHVPGLRDGQGDTPASRAAKTSTCDCTCDSCAAGTCADCSCDGNCDAANCVAEDCRCGEGSRMKMRLRLAEASL